MFLLILFICWFVEPQHSYKEVIGIEIVSNSNRNCNFYLREQVSKILNENNRNYNDKVKGEIKKHLLLTGIIKDFESKIRQEENGLYLIITPVFNEYSDEMIIDEVKVGEFKTHISFQNYEGRNIDREYDKFLLEVFIKNAGITKGLKLNPDHLLVIINRLVRQVLYTTCSIYGYYGFIYKPTYIGNSIFPFSSQFGWIKIIETTPGRVKIIISEK
jgi:hypothetical protein